MPTRPVFTARRFQRNTIITPKATSAIPATKSSNSSPWKALVTPTNATILDGVGRARINDNEAPPVLTVTGGSILEPDSSTDPLVFTISLSAVSQREVRFTFETVNGAASAPTDFSARTGSRLRILPGNVSTTISVLVRGNTTPEPTETFSVLISQTVKDLVAGSGFAFEDRGEHTLKGIPDSWRLYRVAEAGGQPSA